MKCRAEGLFIHTYEYECVEAEVGAKNGVDLFANKAKVYI